MLWIISGIILLYNLLCVISYLIFKEGEDDWK